MTFFYFYSILHIKDKRKKILLIITGSLAEGIISADPGTPLLKKQSWTIADNKALGKSQELLFYKGESLVIMNITDIQTCADFFLEKYLKTFYLVITWCRCQKSIFQWLLARIQSLLFFDNWIKLCFSMMHHDNKGIYPFTPAQSFCILTCL